MCPTTGTAEARELLPLTPTTTTLAERAAVAPKDIAWAARQGAHDRKRRHEVPTVQDVP
jgi:hypothetical protein